MDQAEVICHQAGSHRLRRLSSAFVTVTLVTTTKVAC